MEHTFTCKSFAASHMIQFYNKSTGFQSGRN